MITSSMVKGLCFVSPWLFNYTGHNLNYATSVFQAAKAKELAVKVWGRKDCDPNIIKTLLLEPVFQLPATGISGIGRWLRPFKTFSRFFHDLWVVDVTALDYKWVVFVEGVNHTQLLAWVLWLFRFRPGRAPTLVIMLRFGLSISSEKRWISSTTLMWLALQMLKQWARIYPVQLVTDSEFLACEYKSLTRQPVTLLPIPHTKKGESERSPVLELTPRAKLRFVSPGRPMLYKGFALLVQAIELLHDRGQLSGMDFTVQYYDVVFREPGGSEYAERLRQLNASEVHLIERSLSEDAYRRLIIDADVIVLPYYRDHYKAATSGPFTEALAFGKPVIVTEGTWMGAQLEKHGAGITFCDQDVEGLAHAILEARDNYPALAEQARTLRADWVGYHNPDNFLSELLKVAAKGT